MEIYALLPIGILTGIISGYFGMGGGTILVPILLLYGFDIKSAVSIAVLQMFMGSIYGTYLNYKNTNVSFRDVGFIVLGGFVGGQGSVYIIEVFSELTLQIMLLSLIFLGMFRIIKSVEKSAITVEISPIKLFVIGALIGLFAISVGVGGALLLIPILVGYFSYSTQKAAVAGLFFVLFSSFSGVIGLGMAGELLIKEGLITGLGALIGVYIGIKATSKSSAKLHKSLLLSLYISVSIIVIYKIVNAL